MLYSYMSNLKAKTMNEINDLTIMELTPEGLVTKLKSGLYNVSIYFGESSVNFKGDELVCYINQENRLIIAKDPFNTFFIDLNDIEAIRMYLFPTGTKQISIYTKS